MKTRVDPDLCTGCELCVQTCPDVFEMTDDSVAQAKAEVVPEAQQGSCREAAEDCPVEAIQIED